MSVSVSEQSRHERGLWSPPWSRLAPSSGGRQPSHRPGAPHAAAVKQGTLKTSLSLNRGVAARETTSFNFKKCVIF